MWGDGAEAATGRAGEAGSTSSSTTIIRIWGSGGQQRSRNYSADAPFDVRFGDISNGS